MKNIKCPKCKSNNVEPKISFGGPAVYEKLVCQNCGYEGGTSRVYTGEDARVQREIIKRFLDKDNQPDGVRTTLAGYGL